MVNFFIDRPVFSAVISIVITLVGAICILTLPIAQYPQIVPPTVQVSATYDGASAQVVEESVATPIEQEVNGAQDMLYMNSVSSNDGRMVLNVTFDISRDLDLATVDVQNRVALANSRLPSEVVSRGISVKKQSPDMLLVINLSSPDGSRDTLFLNNYAKINITDALARVPGVGNVAVFGERDYGMRVWLDPDKLARLGLTSSDVAQAIREQNVQAPAGQIGLPPAPPGQEFQLSVQVKGRLADPEEFADIIVRTGKGAEMVRVRDVGRVELGSQSYSAFTRLNGNPTCTIQVYQLPGANALDVVEKIRAIMAEQAGYFPPGVSYTIPYDTTKFVTASIHEVIKTLFEAVLLVLIVVYVFLQNGRATLIPMLTVPVSLVGAFAFMQVFGFSINTLTLFGLVLAIGIVVDDAIVVVEAVQHKIDHEKLPPREATKAAMAEVAGPVIAISLVLISVFVPVAFMGGVTGRLYQQFALTLAVSVALSAICALTLSPALCALILRPAGEGKGPLGAFFRGFNRVFDACTRGYAAGVRVAIRRMLLTIICLFAVGAGAWHLLVTLPTGFVPDEDQGYFIVNAMLPEGASLERNDAVVKQLEQTLSADPAVADVLALGGFNLLTSTYSSYSSVLFVILKPWEDRATPQLSLDAVMDRTRKQFAGVQEAIVMAFNPSPIPGLGTTGGFQFELQDRTGGPVAELAATAYDFLAEARTMPAVTGLFTDFSVEVPQLFYNLDRDKVQTLGIPPKTVFEALQTYLGGLYVNDFNKFGRTYRVMLQAEPRFRTSPADIERFYVRSSADEMVPLSTLGVTKDIRGPEYIRRFNLFRTVEISGGTPEGFSSGQSLKSMAELARDKLPQGFGYAWTGIAYQEATSGGQSVFIFGLALLMVFLVLAAQYESWAVPFAVILAVPMAVLGAMGAQMLRGLENNVYAQIGLVMLIGLAAKNAILIVEFAKARHEAGDSPAEAAVSASILRFRPILMTSFAFILGVVPMLVAKGAGAASRHALGTAVFGGMIAATVLGVYFVPALYCGIQRLVSRGDVKGEKTAE
ncbi:efflux RND transporter permease subunit [Solidesulfovibrio magneticus]|uniref:Efflux system protein n=1 Tax=Solidesulfovibrio magneticus (strain ATCC 700980 / DSM 13731 / RS-1) TaxID=573370 RepID=C4XHF7_SOLM1|nr:multidrug efflux RND transporter permease subunit [Solidesulfovibrio magneticus]BAH73925.1 efflux system protein [Solidesulfovibrio magneticus RS-1]